MEFKAKEKCIIHIISYIWSNNNNAIHYSISFEFYLIIFFVFCKNNIYMYSV